MDIAEKALRLKQDFDDVKMAGYAEGYPNGEKDGFANGYEYGKTDGYNSGVVAGKEQGIEIGVEQGRQAERNDSWDRLQQNGERTCYNYTFFDWSDDMFYPKYDIILGQKSGTTVHSQGAFAYAKINNLKQRLEECGVKLTLASGTVQSMFLGCQTEELPVFDCSSAGWISWVLMFQGCTTKNLHMKNGIFHYINDPLNGCANLEDINLENCSLKGNGFNKLRLDTCPKLKPESIVNVFNALEDITSSGTARVITLGAEHLAKLTEDEKAIATEKGWSLV